MVRSLGLERTAGGLNTSAPGIYGQLCSAEQFHSLHALGFKVTIFWPQ